MNKHIMCDLDQCEKVKDLKNELKNLRYRMEVTLAKIVESFKNSPRSKRDKEVFDRSVDRFVKEFKDEGK